MVIQNAVLISVQDPSESILSVLQSVYNQQENFPDVIYVSDGNNTFKLLVNFSTADNLGTLSFV